MVYFAYPLLSPACVNQSESVPIERHERAMIIGEMGKEGWDVRECPSRLDKRAWLTQASETLPSSEIGCVQLIWQKGIDAQLPFIRKTTRSEVSGVENVMLLCVLVTILSLDVTVSWFSTEVKVTIWIFGGRDKVFHSRLADNRIYL